MRNIVVLSFRVFPATWHAKMSKSLFFFERPASQRLKEGKEEKKTRVEEAREWTGQQVVKAFKQEFPVNKATWSVYRDSFYFKPDPKDKGYIKKVGVCLPLPAHLLFGH